jgi:25S rRNA (cytosine2870-C5)-methyltransferase
MAQLMKNTGVIIANDLKAERQKATVANLHRLGVKNVIACTHDGRKLGKKFHNSFDRILLDAPCSGLGVISRDPSVKVQRTMADVQKIAHLQKELILSAIDALNHKSKTGGCMVYSTCSVSVFENEEVINYALSKRDIKIIDSGLDFGKFLVWTSFTFSEYQVLIFPMHVLTTGKPGFTRYQQKRFHPTVALTRRFYPHVHNMDGFYVAKIQKLSDRKPEDYKEPQDDEVEETVEESKIPIEAAPKKPVSVKAAPANPVSARSVLNTEDVDSSDKEEAPKKKWVVAKGKKRKGITDKPKKVKKARSDHQSVPPKQVVHATTSTKAATKNASAKTSKPRRRKLEDHV